MLESPGALNVEFKGLLQTVQRELVLEKHTEMTQADIRDPIN